MTIATARLETILPPSLRSALETGLGEWDASAGSRRLWERDATLWTASDEARWLGWLDLPERTLQDSALLGRLAGETRAEGFTHALLLGMGGSSLCPEVLSRCFPPAAGFPRLLVLDSTDPGQVRDFERQVDLPRTLFIVSSKSGTTLEPNILRDYFLERATQAVGAGAAARRFIAITDPGSSLDEAAREGRYRAVLHGVPSVGGRYSALSLFGMAPAAISGLDAPRLLEGARAMAALCGPLHPARENPGALLGLGLAAAARAGRDKLTFISSGAIAPLGSWLEQLVAESTGKSGRGIIPVEGEPVGDAGSYGDDRIFVHTRLEGAVEAGEDEAVAALARAGHPVVRITMNDPYDLGAEFFRWQMATAVAGAALGINPFDQPDVEASKAATRELTATFERTGALPSETPAFSAEGLGLYASGEHAGELQRAARSAGGNLAAWLRVHLQGLGEGGYLALLAYIPMRPAHERPLREIRLAARHARRVATCLGYGPRFLHSTGQAYKGGPAGGVFLQITCDDAEDLAIPKRRATFGIVKGAQARGDFEVLAARGRRILRVHVTGSLPEGLERLAEAFRQAIKS